MMRIPFGILILLHGFAHSAAGIWASTLKPAPLVMMFWIIATIGFVGAGLGILGAPFIRRAWTAMTVAAVFASIVLLLPVSAPPAYIGLLLDLLLLAILIGSASLGTIAPHFRTSASSSDGRGHSVLRRGAAAVSMAAFIYVSAVALLRPVYLQWGTTAAERDADLPGDEFTPDARYRVTHALTIRAPASSVWPWLAQIPQDRGSAPGWKIQRVVPGSALVLEGASFALVPQDSTTTRLIIRRRGAGLPSFRAVLLGWTDIFLFEPAHLIMQCELMRGIRARAESSVGD